MQTERTEQKQKTSASHKVLTVVGIVLCVILVPMLLANIVMIIKSYTNKDEVPSVFNVVPMIVLTDSMVPEIYGGDLIICTKIDAADVQKEDIIAFFDPASKTNSVLTHRVKEITELDGERAFITRGDANNDNDKDPVPAKDLIGEYKFRIPGLGKVAMFMQTTAGLIVCVVIPILLLIGYDVIRRRLYEKNNKKDTDALLKELETLRAAKAAEESAPKADAEAAEEPVKTPDAE